MTAELFQIREIREDDLEEVCGVVRKALMPEVRARNSSQSAIKANFESNNPQNLRERITGNFFFVAESINNGKIVGVIGLRRDTGSESPNRVSTFDVDPEFQGQGVGRSLYQRVEKKARELGCRKIVVSSSLSAELIYAHWGFKRIREIMYDLGGGNNYLNIWMEKDL